MKLQNLSLTYQNVRPTQTWDFHTIELHVCALRAAGSRSRLDSVIQGYSDGEYDFGIDLAALKSITGYDNDEAKELQQVLVKNENTGMYVLCLLIFYANK